MSKHTPRPWVVDECGGRVLTTNFDMIADVRGWGRLQKKKDGEKEFLCNCRLIAAAPEMYELLKKFAEWNEKYPTDRFYSYEDTKKIAAKCDTIYAKVKEVLKKVEGEA